MREQEGHSELKKEAKKSKPVNPVAEVNTLLEHSLKIVDTDPDQVLSDSLAALEIAKSINDASLECMCYLAIAKAFNNKSDYRNSIENCLKGLELSDQQNDKEKTLKFSNLCGLNHLDMGDYDSALDYFQTVIKIAEETNHTLGLGSDYNNTGLIFKVLQEFEKAMEYFHKARKLYSQANYPEGIVASYTNMGNLHSEKERYEEAMKKFKSALKVSKENNYVWGIMSSMTNIGATYGHLGKIDEGLKHYKQAHKLGLENKNDYILSMLSLNIGEVCFSKGEKEKGFELIRKALVIAEKIDVKTIMINAHKSLAKKYEKEENWKSANDHIRKHAALEIEVNDAQVRKKAANIYLQKELKLKEQQTEIHRIKNEELKKTLKELKALQGELVKKERLATIGEIATQIAHEVQNPLNFINNFSEINAESAKELRLAFSENQLSNEANQLLDQIGENAAIVHQHGKRVADIVSRLLKKTWNI